METRANFVLIGAFTLAGLFGALGLILWLAKVEVDRQYTYYDALFDNVSGLGQASDVRYNGLPVGQVVALDLDRENPSKVRVRIEVTAGTPVKLDTIAQIQSQGVTGVSFVALSGGSAEAERLPENGLIQSRRSALESVFESAPLLLEKAIVLLEDVNAVFDDQNRAAVGDILDNLATASGRLDRALADFEGLSGDLGLAARQVAAFSDRLTALSDTAEITLNSATETLTSARSTIQRADGAVDSAISALDSAEAGFTTAKALMEGDLADFIRQGTSTATTIETTLQKLEPEAASTLQAARDTLTTAQQTFASVNDVIDEDLSGAVSDVRHAAGVFATTVEAASENIDAISGELLNASRSASSFVGNLDGIVAENRRQVSDFLRVGLPEFVRFTEEARVMLSNLERLVERVERDPARFLLGTQNSEFRR